MSDAADKATLQLLVGMSAEMQAVVFLQGTSLRQSTHQANSSVILILPEHWTSVDTAHDVQSIVNAGHRASAHQTYCTLTTRVTSCYWHCPSIGIVYIDQMLINQLLVQCMEYLHTKSIVHFDLKSANLLLGYKDRRAICKVADFGLSKQKRDTYVSNVSSQRGTLPWIAPEIIKTPNAVTEKVCMADHG